jgi:cell division septation protein DedD
MYICGMKELISHIEFLIMQHECVIIPNIGGFVLNKERAHIQESGVIIAPTLNVGFNASLKYNDGLLAESYMQKYAIPYDDALSRINEDVKHVRSELITRKEILFGKIGVLKLNNGYIIYEPAHQGFIHPCVWGCSNVELKKLSDMVEPAPLPTKSFLMRRMVIGVASTAAAIALWAVAPSVNQTMFRTIQQSGFFVGSGIEYEAKKIDSKRIISTELDALLDEYASSIAKQNGQPAIEKPAEVKQPEAVVAEQIKAISVKDDRKEPVPQASKPALTKVKRYFVIVGGDENKSGARSLLSQFRSSGFKDADIVDSPERYRVYVAVFNDKPDADAYLSRFRRKYPAHADAWIFTKQVAVK